MCVWGRAVLLVDATCFNLVCGGEGVQGRVEGGGSFAESRSQGDGGWIHGCRFTRPAAATAETQLPYACLK